MTWYDVHLGTNGVQELDRLFGESPYTIEKSRGVNTVHIALAGGEVAPFSYNEGKIVIFHGVINSLPQEVQADIQERLGRLDSLEKVVERIRLYGP